MGRNIILFISTAAVLVLAFAVYQALVRDVRPPEQPAARSELPQEVTVDEEKTFKLRELDIAPGRQMAFVSYDPVTGQPVEYLKVDTWEKVPGTTDEVLLVRPELMMRPPSGMIITIAAESGRVKANLVDDKRLQPQRGYLDGQARIVIDRNTAYQRPPLDERPEDRIVIETQRLEFDLELGEVRAEHPLVVRGHEFEIQAGSLKLLWNRDDNRIEKLEITGGGQMTLIGGLLARFEQRPGQQPAASAPVRSTPAAEATPRQTTPYRCRLDGGVEVQHFVGDQPRGALRADSLTLLVDIARGGDLAVGPAEAAPASQPAAAASAPAAPQPRLVVRWQGEMVLVPDEPAQRTGSEPRRRVEALGDPVVVELPNGRVRCGRLALFEEYQRLWLYPHAGQVTVEASGRLSVSSASMFVDLQQRLIKLIGPVALDTSLGGRRDTETLRIACEGWAELHLARSGDRRPMTDPLAAPLAAGAPESAVFVGDVLVSLGQQSLRAHRFETRFRPPPPEPAAADSAGGRPRGLQAQLESATAIGDVELVARHKSDGPSWWRTLRRSGEMLTLTALRTVQAALGQRRPVMSASPDERTLRCARLELRFAQRAEKMAVSSMHAAGAVRLRDLSRHFAAAGRELLADFDRDDELRTASVRGSPARLARVRARGYDLRGVRIDVDNPARTLDVRGASRLVFRSRRSLQGLVNLTDEFVTVTSTQYLHVDDRANRVEFAGDVVAGTTVEQLRADRLILELVPAEDSGRSASLIERLAGLKQTLLRRDKPRAQRAVPADRDSTRKNLRTVVARNAVIASTLPDPAGGRPLVERSVSSPELQIDVEQRIIRTVGRTVLGMTSRQRSGPRQRRQTPVPGFSSALLTNDASVTAMSSERGLIYSLDPEGPRRRDTVLFQGAVQFQYVAVEDPARLEATLQRIVDHGGPLEDVPGRHTIVTCDRLEVAFEIASGAGLAFGGARMNLTWLNASGNVRLRDQQRSRVRTIFAHQIEYDARDQVLWVLGWPEKAITARIYDEDRRTHRLNFPVEGYKLTVNLRTGTIETGRLRGRIGG